MADTTEALQEDTSFFSATDINTLLVALKLLQDDIRSCDSEYCYEDEPVEVLSEDEIDDLCDALQSISPKDNQSFFSDEPEDKPKVLVTLGEDGIYPDVFHNSHINDNDVQIFSWLIFNQNDKAYQNFFSAEFAELAEQAGIPSSCVQSESSSDEDSPSP